MAEKRRGSGAGWVGSAPERGFLVLAAAFGLIFVFLTPPMQVPDEIRHLARAVMIARGDFLAIHRDGVPGHFIPRSVDEMELRLGPEIAFDPQQKQDAQKIYREFSVPVDEGDRVFRVLPSLYSPVPYLPQVLAIRVAQIFDGAPIVYVYLGRLLNLGIWWLLVFWAIRRAPAHKWLLVALALTPMSLFIAASLSVDVMTNGLSFLFIAQLLHSSRSDSMPVSRLEIARLFSVAVLLGLTKPTYWPLALLVFLIPGVRFRDFRHRAGSMAFLVLGSLAPALIWSFAVTRLGVPSLWDGADPAAQIAWIRSQPLRYALVVLTSVPRLATDWILNFVGSLGYFDVWLPVWVYFSYPALLIGVAVIDGGSASPVHGRGRLLLLAVAVLTWVAVVTVSYVAWNPVGQSVLWGIQGRYFIPIAPLVLICLHLGPSRGLARSARLGVLAYCTLVLGVTALSLWDRYYVS